MMNLVSRCSERIPDELPSTASESPWKTRHASQSSLSPQTEQRCRTERSFVFAYLSSYSEWNVDKTWSSQEWKSDELMEDRTGRPVVTAQHTDRFTVENDKMNSYTEAESEMSLESRSFLHTMNDQVRKRQNQSSKDATKRQQQTFCDLDLEGSGMRLISTINLQKSRHIVWSFDGARWESGLGAAGLDTVVTG